MLINGSHCGSRQASCRVLISFWIVIPRFITQLISPALDARSIKIVRANLIFFRPNDSKLPKHPQLKGEL